MECEKDEYSMLDKSLLRQHYHKLELTCPMCNTKGAIDIHRALLSDLVKDNPDEKIEFSVFPGDICVHEFTVHLKGEEF